ncbi:hypothetical protein XANCAGTX0491_004637 [Xanthoria calcicola]
MARGNQRDKAREKNQKEMAGQKNKNTQSGTEFARTKEAQAAIMRAKQEGMDGFPSLIFSRPGLYTTLSKHLPSPQRQQQDPPQYDWLTEWKNSQRKKRRKQFERRQKEIKKQRSPTYEPESMSDMANGVFF